MRRVTYRFAAALAAFLLSLPAARGEIVNGIAIKVGNTVVTINEFDKAYGFARKQALLQGSEAPSKKKVTEDLVDEALVRIEGERRGIIVTDEEVNDIIDNIKKQNNFSDEQLNEQLVLEGLTLKDLKAQYTREMVKARLINLMGSEAGGGISEEDVRAFYDDPANRERLSVTGTGSVTLSRLFIPVPDSASYKEALDLKNEVSSVYERAKGGEDFESLVREHSRTPDKAEMGTFTQEQLLTVFTPEVAKAIFSLGEGDVAPPMRSKEGYFIIKIKKKNPEALLPYEEASEYIRSLLFKTKADEQFAAWIEQKRRMTRIEYLIGTE
jgi:peptidyl-prolyl cis-trans isomerase SurA